MAQIFVKNIDFPLLREQKRSLLKLIYSNTLSTKLEDDLTGILHLIDHLQDQASESGIDDNLIFDSEEDEVQTPNYLQNSKTI